VIKAGLALADTDRVDLIKGHVLAVSIVALALVVVSTVFMFAHPAYHPYVVPAPPDHGLPYTTVDYEAADARRAFDAQGIALNARSQSPTMTTLGNLRDVVSVTVFGERAKVEAAGFWNYTTDATGHYVHFPHDCASGIPGVPGSYDAELWQGNVRVIVNCNTAGRAGAAWISRAQHALARL
jgi:hypothetical protein